MTSIATLVPSTGLVVLDCPRSSIAPEFLRIEQHAALITWAAREARGLGGRPSPVGACSVTFPGDLVRFTWLEERPAPSTPVR